MGQAKLRGTLEQRIQEGEAKKLLEKIALDEKRKEYNRLRQIRLANMSPRDRQNHLFLTGLLDMYERNKDPLRLFR